jgi:hypothetical protein
MWLDPTQPGICAGVGRRSTVWSQSVSCSTVAGCYYQSESNCQNSLPDLDTYYACTSGVPPTWGQLQSSCNIANGACGRSDERLKRGIETLSGSLEKIMKISAVEYDWNSKLNEYEYLKEHDKLHTIGLIAQEVKEYFPEVVLINPDGYYWIDYSKLNAVLVEAIKEQQLFIEEIDKELEFIESKLI